MGPWGREGLLGDKGRRGAEGSHGPEGPKGDRVSANVHVHVVFVYCVSGRIYMQV